MIAFDPLRAAVLATAATHREIGDRLASRDHASTAATSHALAASLDQVAASDDALDMIRKVYSDVTRAADTGDAMTRQTTCHGYPIVDRKPSKVPGSAVILAIRPGNFQPFVVWRMEADGACEGGQYIEGIARAAEAFAERL